MSAFDRLQNYSASNKVMTSEVFDVTSPQGCFLEKLHSQGYKMYEYVYENISGGTISEERYQWLSDEDKKSYTRKFQYTELHDMLVTSGDQLVLANAGSGKALANDTNVLTSKGYVPIGDLKVDDEVFGTDLQLHNVVGVYPQGKKKVNRMTIKSDNATYRINCCDEHLWAVQSWAFQESDITTVLSTKDIKKKLKDTKFLPLVEVSPFDFNKVDSLALSEVDKARLFISLLTKLCPALENLGSEMYNAMDSWCFFPLRDYVKEEDEVFFKCLDDSLSTDFIFLDASFKLGINCDTYLRERLYDSSTVDKFVEKLSTIITLKEKDTVKLFNGCSCNYYITSVDETDSETEMTCIEVDADNHLFLIEGLIPTHNTTALIFKIMHDIITGEATKLTSIPNGNQVRVVDDIFVGTFLKTGADELAERLAYWQRGLGYTVTADRVNFSTLHAEFKRVLNTMGAATPIGKDSEISKCMRKAIDGLGISREGSALSAEDYKIISGIITYYRGRLDHNRYNHPSAGEYGLTPVLLDRLVSDFANQRQLAGIMDFEDLQELLYKFLYVTPNKAVQDFCANRYKYIYLDEFQDTSQIQYAIIKFYARGRLWLNRGTSTEEDSKSILYTGNETLGKIVVVGDNDQCVTEDTVLRMYYPNDIVEVVTEPPKKPSLDDIVMQCKEAQVQNNHTEFKPIRDIKKGDFVCCADNEDSRYWQSDEEDDDYSYGMSATQVIEEPIVHKRRNIDLYRITVYDYIDDLDVELTLECSSDHILFTNNKNLAIPNEVYKTLIKDTDEGSTERGFFTLEHCCKKEKFTMVYAKDLSVGDYVLIEKYAGSLTLNEIISIEKVHYDEVDLYDIHTDARNYSANGFVSHNCLYSWRGSDNAIIENDFDNDFRPCHSTLSYNYRCPSNILDAIIPSIKMNKGNDTREYRSAREGGICKGYHFTSYKGMLNQLVEDIDTEMQEGNTVAVLCRTNYDGVLPAFILESNKKYDFSISGQNMTFDSPLPKKIIAIASLFTERNSPAVKNTLSMFVPRYAEWSVKQLVDTLKNNGKNIWQIPDADLEYSCPELAPMIKTIKGMFYEGGKRVQEKEMNALKFVYHWIMTNTFGGSSLYCESARAYIEALLYIIDNNNFESVFEFVEHINNINERLHARVSNTKAKISIVTVHEFKGKERDTSIVWNDSDGVFPSSKTDVENESELEDERRVHYVACTRARKKNLVYTIYGKEGIFAKEMNIEFESPQKIGGKLPNKAQSTQLSEDESNLLEVMKSMQDDTNA